MHERVGWKKASFEFQETVALLALRQRPVAMPIRRMQEKLTNFPIYLFEKSVRLFVGTQTARQAASGRIYRGGMPTNLDNSKKKNVRLRAIWKKHRFSFVFIPSDILFKCTTDFCNGDTHSADANGIPDAASDKTVNAAKMSHRTVCVLSELISMAKKKP